MFTGLVEDMGTVTRADRRSNALVLAVKPARIPVSELAIGDSVCHDGACLTVTETTRESAGDPNDCTVLDEVWLTPEATDSVTLVVAPAYAVVTVEPSGRVSDSRRFSASYV